MMKRGKEKEVTGGGGKKIAKVLSEEEQQEEEKGRSARPGVAGRKRGTALEGEGKGGKGEEGYLEKDGDGIRKEEMLCGRREEKRHLGDEKGRP